MVLTSWPHSQPSQRSHRSGEIWITFLSFFFRHYGRPTNLVPHNSPWNQNMTRRNKISSVKRKWAPSQWSSQWPRSDFLFPFKRDIVWTLCTLCVVLHRKRIIIRFHLRVMPCHPWISPYFPFVWTVEQRSLDFWNLIRQAESFCRVVLRTALRTMYAFLHCTGCWCVKPSFESSLEDIQQ